MGVPKRRVSHARKGERRAHLALSVPKLEECDHCHAHEAAAPRLSRTVAGTTAARRSTSSSRRPSPPPDRWSTRSATDRGDRPTDRGRPRSRSTRWAATTDPTEVVPGAIDYARANPTIASSSSATRPTDPVDRRRSCRPTSRSSTRPRSSGWTSTRPRPSARRRTRRSSSPRTSSSGARPTPSSPPATPVPGWPPRSARSDACRASTGPRSPSR